MAGFVLNEDSIKPPSYPEPWRKVKPCLPRQGPGRQDSRLTPGSVMGTHLVACPRDVSSLPPKGSGEAHGLWAQPEECYSSVRRCEASQSASVDIFSSGTALPAASVTTLISELRAVALSFPNVHLNGVGFSLYLEPFMLKSLRALLLRESTCRIHQDLHHCSSINTVVYDF